MGYAPQIEFRKQKNRTSRPGSFSDIGLVSGKQRDETRKENPNADDRRRNGRDKHRSGGYVLDYLHLLVELRAQHVHQVLESGIEKFERQDNPYREKNDQPFRPGQRKKHGEYDRESGQSELDTEISLRLHRMSYAICRMSETFRELDHKNTVTVLFLYFTTDRRSPPS